MTKPQEILTPSLLELGDLLVKYTKDGFRIQRGPELLGWQYYCEMVKETIQEVAATTTAPVTLHKTARGPKPKVKAAEEPKA